DASIKIPGPGGNGAPVLRSLQPESPVARDHVILTLCAPVNEEAMPVCVMPAHDFVEFGGGSGDDPLPAHGPGFPPDPPPGAGAEPRQIRRQAQSLDSRQRRQQTQAQAAAQAPAPGPARPPHRDSRSSPMPLPPDSAPAPGPELRMTCNS